MNIVKEQNKKRYTLTGSSRLVAVRSGAVFPSLVCRLSARREIVPV